MASFSIHAEECFAKCKEYAKYIEIERYLRTLNKMVGDMTDALDFDAALGDALDNIKHHNKLLELRNDILNNSSDEEGSINYGIAFSQLGQCLAFRRDGETEETFQLALEQMGDHQSPNYAQTQSYLLYHYIDTNKQNNYDTCAVEYFGGNDAPAGQLGYILEQGKLGNAGKFNPHFAMFVYTKGLYRFHLNTALKDPELLSSLYDIEQLIIRECAETTHGRFDQHP